MLLSAPANASNASARVGDIRLRVEVRTEIMDAPARASCLGYQQRDDGGRMSLTLSWDSPVQHAYSGGSVQSLGQNTVNMTVF